MITGKEWISFVTISRREIHRLLRIWPQTLLPPVITTSLYFLIFGRLIGPRVGSFEGNDFIVFIVPGLIMMTIITNSYLNTVSSFFSAKFMKSIEELLVSPTPDWIILVGYTTGGIIRGMLIGVIVTLTAMFYTPIHIHHFLNFVVICFLSATFFSLCGLINAFYAKKFDDIAIIPSFVLTPLTYLGGIFYPLTLLDAPWRQLSYLNPIAYIIDSARYSFIDVHYLPIMTAEGMLLLFTVILFMICLRKLSKLKVNQ